MPLHGDVIASAGDPDFFAYFRSSAKPFQAIPLVASGAADAYGFTRIPRRNVLSRKLAKDEVLSTCW